MSDFKMGDRVAWVYRHHTNSRTSFVREKVGTVQSAVAFKFENILGRRTRVTDREHIPVLFDGNQKPSKVKRREIRRVEHTS